MELAQLKNLIRDVPDFPKAGISYKDITTLLKDPAGLMAAIRAMLGPFADDGVELVVGIESRGFILATPMALDLGCGFVPVRKPGKLPAETLRQEYDLEYGSDAVEIHADAIAPGQKVLLVDDVLATGGTLAATCQLLEKLGAEIVGISVLAELSFLQGRERLPECRLASAIVY
jgi:adenine phosphoribosyltransferase